MAIGPVCRDSRGQNAVAGLLERRVPILLIAFESGTGSPQHDQVLDSGLNLYAAARPGDLGSALLLAAARESVPIHADPLALGDFDAHARDLPVVTQKMPDQLAGEIFDLLAGPGLGQRIDRVLHRVGGEHGPVVARGVNRIEIAFELNINGDLGEVVAIGVARDLQYPPARFSLIISAK